MDILSTVKEKITLVFDNRSWIAGFPSSQKLYKIKISTQLINNNLYESNSTN